MPMFQNLNHNNEQYNLCLPKPHLGESFGETRIIGAT